MHVNAECPSWRQPGEETEGLVTYPQFLDSVYHAHLHRNSAEFSWADGSEEPLDANETPDLFGDVVS
jgi:hypothetical protein